MLKKLVIEIINKLPDDVTLEEIIDSIYMSLKIEQGLKAVENKDILSEEEVLKEIEKW